MTTKVPGQGGPYFQIHDDSSGPLALKAILETPGARNLVEELRRVMHRRTVEDTAELFDISQFGMIFGPAAVVRELKHAVEVGMADNYTFHFAVTAVAYAMALEKLDPGFFKERQHVADDRLYDTYQEKRQAIMEYVRNLEKKT